MTHFELTNVRSGYGRSFAVEFPSLSIRARRMNIITGANGSGKSTLLNVLAFLKRPDQGEMSFAGQLVTWKKSDLQQLRQRVTLVDQMPYLFSGTVGSNVGFGLKLRGVRGEELDQGISNALSLVCLADFERRDVRQLSGGEHRRVAIARAIALNPEVLLLDEPLANLDTHSTRVVERLISVLPEFGTTAVMATHDISIAERFDCDVICLAGGRLDRSPEVPVCRPSMMPAY